MRRSTVYLLELASVVMLTLFALFLLGYLIWFWTNTQASQELAEAFTEAQVRHVEINSLLRDIQKQEVTYPEAADKIIEQAAWFSQADVRMEQLSSPLRVIMLRTEYKEAFSLSQDFYQKTEEGLRLLEFGLRFKSLEMIEESKRKFAEAQERVLEINLLLELARSK